MLKSISLENYKCFKNKTEIEIAPLTVLCGVNSSGKSSIINSLLLQKQSYEDNSTFNNMKFNGAYVKCGKFSDLSSQKNNNDIKFQISYELKKPTKFRRGTQRSSKHDITAFKNLSKMYSWINVSSFRITSSIAIKTNESANYINDNILANQEINIKVVSAKDVFETIISLKHLNANQYVIILKNVPNGDSFEKIVELRNSACYFENFNLINAYSTDIKPAGTTVSGVLANVYLICKMNILQFKNIHYLTPLRVYPQRNYILDNETEDVGLSGEFTPHVMYKFQKATIDGFLPPQNDIVSKSIKRVPFNDCVQQWMNYIKFGKYTLSNAMDTLQLNISQYNISGVGFGVSQVLPILVSGLIKKENEILLLEQPEIHLHPGAQMSMADYLLSMAANNRGVIVETHSDHIINRIVRRLMEDKCLHSIVKIYFVDQTDDGLSSISEIEVDDRRGVLTDNENFFTQFASETEKIISTAYRNRIIEGNKNG